MGETRLGWRNEAGLEVTMFESGVLFPVACVSRLDISCFFKFGRCTI